jgi:hypothetical protein
MIRFVTGLHGALYIQGDAIEYDDIHVSVLMNWVEYKKHKKLRNVISEMQFSIRLSILKSYVS